jgi:hypothetical protein
MMEGGKARYPKQEVNEKAGQKHSYVGEDTGELETYEPPKAGNSNAVPDLETAEARVDSAKRALERAERDLDLAKSASKDAEKTKPASKPVVGGQT